MSLPVALVFVLTGIGLLAAGGEALVRGAVSLARLLRVSTIVIGLTIVAMGTSAPELAASLTASLHGRGDIAVGNVVGSNILNIALIVGMSAVLLPITVHLSAIRVEWPVMLALTVAVVAMAQDGVINRVEGIGLVLTLALFIGYLIVGAKRPASTRDGPSIEIEVDSLTVRAARHQGFVDAGLILVGVAMLVVGAQALVRGAVVVAEFAGLSERVIGLTVVAFGTSLPELATSLVAARRGQAEIALANVIGSNIFNLTAILGVVAIVTPQHVPRETVTLDFWWMLGYAVILLPMMRVGMRITRVEGAALLAGYGVYLFFLLR
jgi:cation:H+ antiporter